MPITDEEQKEWHAKKIWLKNRELVLADLLKQVAAEQELIEKLKARIAHLKSKQANSQ
jgi:hypothetical protein